MKKYTLHLDAAIFLGLIFLASIMGNILMLREVERVTKENVDVKAGNMLYRMNNESMDTSLQECLERESAAGQE